MSAGPTLFEGPALWRAVRERVAPYLRTYPSVNVWVADCGTGGAAFTAAIVLREAGLLERSRVYATDRDEAALDRAREAWIDRARLDASAAGYRASGGPSALEEYYALDAPRAALRGCVTDRVVFAQHDPATDGSFNEFQLIVLCEAGGRVDPAVARRRRRVARDSLCRFGFIALGGARSADDDLEDLDPAVGLYRKVNR
jgi:chemotaxis protein methyltransferase CheR